VARLLRMPTQQRVQEFLDSYMGNFMREEREAAESILHNLQVSRAGVRARGHASFYRCCSPFANCRVVCLRVWRLEARAASCTKSLALRK